MMRHTPLAVALALLGSTSLVGPVAAAAANSPYQASPQAKAPEAGSLSSSDAAGDKNADAQNGGSQTTPPSMADIKTRIQKDRAAFFEAHLAALHAGLQLQGDQDGMWAPVEDAIRDFSKLRRPHEDKDEAQDNNDDDGGNDHPGIDRLRARSEHLIGKGQAMKKLVDATEPLLDSLSAAQKERLPILLEGLRPRRILQAAFGLDDASATAATGRFGDDPQFQGGHGVGGAGSGFGRGNGGEPGPGAGYEQRFQQFPGARSDGAAAGGGFMSPWSFAGGRNGGGGSRDDED